MVSAPKHTFRPTEAMKIYAFQRAEYPHLTQKDIAKKTGLNESTISRWKNQPGWDEWFDQTLATYATPIMDRLKEVAMDNIKNYQFWQALAEKMQADPTAEMVQQSLAGDIELPDPD